MEKCSDKDDQSFSHTSMRYAPGHCFLQFPTINASTMLS